jgi:hypothetical protein
MLSARTESYHPFGGRRTACPVATARSIANFCTDVEDVLAAVEKAVDMPERPLTKNHAKRNYTMRLLHYPAIQGPVKDGQERCGEHTDWGTITLLFQGGQGGLEVRRRTGEWIFAPPLADLRPGEHRRSVTGMDRGQARLHAASRASRSLP